MVAPVGAGGIGEEEGRNERQVPQPFKVARMQLQDTSERVWKCAEVDKGR